MTIFTIGHSTRPVEALIELLAAAEVALLADVRAFPRSRHNPQFNDDALAPRLAAVGIAYRHFRALGGRRGRDRRPADRPTGSGARPPSATTPITR